MDFFDSLAVAFPIWQMACLSPFSLSDHQMTSVSKQIHRNFSFAVMFTQCLVIILSLVFLKFFIYPELPQALKTIDTIQLLLVQVTALVIFCESYKKRFIQMDFLRKINSIDFILEYKIGISPNYMKRRNTNIIRLCRWIFMDVSIFIINFVILFISYVIAHRWWALLYASFAVCSLRYYQITTYVDIIQHRYHQINQFINSIEVKKNDESKAEDSKVLVQTSQNVRTIFQKYKNGRPYEKLSDLRRVCRLLSSANHSINIMFQWSIPTIIMNDFIHILVNSYWTLRIILENKAPLYQLLPPFLWTILNFNHLISLSAVCHHATEEAQNAACFLHKIDLTGRDTTLRDMVGLNRAKITFVSTNLKFNFVK